MKYSVYTYDNSTDEGLNEIIVFLTKDTPATRPRVELFFEAWRNGGLSIFIAEDAGTLVGAAIVLLVPDPIDLGRRHKIVSTKAGENLTEYIESVVGALT